MIPRNSPSYLAVWLTRRKGWTKMTAFNDLDAMSDEDWDKV
jgi:hypothetical protein